MGIRIEKGGFFQQSQRLVELRELPALPYDIALFRDTKLLKQYLDHGRIPLEEICAKFLDIQRKQYHPNNARSPFPGYSKSKEKYLREQVFYKVTNAAHQLQDASPEQIQEWINEYIELLSDPNSYFAKQQQSREESEYKQAHYAHLEESFHHELALQQHALENVRWKADQETRKFRTLSSDLHKIAQTNGLPVSMATSLAQTLSEPELEISNSTTFSPEFLHDHLGAVAKALAERHGFTITDSLEKIIANFIKESYLPNSKLNKDYPQTIRTFSTMLLKSYGNAENIDKEKNLTIHDDADFSHLIITNPFFIAFMVDKSPREEFDTVEFLMTLKSYLRQLAIFYHPDQCQKPNKVEKAFFNHIKEQLGLLTGWIKGNDTTTVNALRNMFLVNDIHKKYSDGIWEVHMHEFRTEYEQYKNKFRNEFHQIISQAFANIKQKQQFQSQIDGKIALKKAMEKYLDNENEPIHTFSQITFLTGGFNAYHPFEVKHNAETYKILFSKLWEILEAKNITLPKELKDHAISLAEQKSEELQNEDKKNEKTPLEVQLTTTEWPFQLLRKLTYVQKILSRHTSYYNGHGRVELFNHFLPFVIAFLKNDNNVKDTHFEKNFRNNIASIQNIVSHSSLLTVTQDLIKKIYSHMGDAFGYNPTEYNVRQTLAELAISFTTKDLLPAMKIYVGQKGAHRKESLKNNKKAVISQGFTKISSFFDIPEKCIQPRFEKKAILIDVIEDLCVQHRHKLNISSKNHQIDSIQLLLSQLLLPEVHESFHTLITELICVRLEHKNIFSESDLCSITLDIFQFLKQCADSHLNQNSFLKKVSTHMDYRLENGQVLNYSKQLSTREIQQMLDSIHSPSLYATIGKKIIQMSTKQQQDMILTYVQYMIEHDHIIALNEEKFFEELTRFSEFENEYFKANTSHKILKSAFRPLHTHITQMPSHEANYARGVLNQCLKKTSHRKEITALSANDIDAMFIDNDLYKDIYFNGQNGMQRLRKKGAQLPAENVQQLQNSCTNLLVHVIPEILGVGKVIGAMNIHLNTFDVEGSNSVSGLISSRTMEQLSQFTILGSLHPKKIKDLEQLISNHQNMHRTHKNTSSALFAKKTSLTALKSYPVPLSLFENTDLYSLLESGINKEKLIVAYREDIKEIALFLPPVDMK